MSEPDVPPSAKPCSFAADGHSEGIGAWCIVHRAYCKAPPLPQITGQVCGEIVSIDNRPLPQTQEAERASACGNCWCHTIKARENVAVGRGPVNSHGDEEIHCPDCTPAPPSVPSEEPPRELQRCESCGLFMANPRQCIGCGWTPPDEPLDAETEARLSLAEHYLGIKCGFRPEDFRDLTRPILRALARDVRRPVEQAKCACRYDPEDAVACLFHAPMFNSIQAQLSEARQALADLAAAIRLHREQRSDDRCWEDDTRLYAALGDGNLGDNHVGDKDAMLANCRRFIENRCAGGKWPTYAELEADRDKWRDLYTAAKTP